MALVIATEPEIGMGQPTSRAQLGQLLDTAAKLTEGLRSLQALLASSLVLCQL